MARVLVTGSTGALGRALLPQLRAQGLEPVEAARRRGVDLGTGDGLAAAVRGVDLVIHAATDPRRTAVVDVGGTHRLVEALGPDWRGHLVYVSIVGVDRIPFGYYRAKLAAEQVVAGSHLPFSIVRSTQWFGFVDGIRRRLQTRPLQWAPMSFRLAPTDVTEYAAVLTHRVMAAPTRSVSEFGGPEDLDVVRMFRRAAGGATVALPIPGRAAAAFRVGAALPGPNAQRGRLTWSEWLGRVAASTNPSDHV